MLSYIIALFAVPALFVAWFIFQNWLAKIDNSYKGYKAGCGGCTRSCGETSEMNINKVQQINADCILNKVKDSEHQ